ncbi:MAG: BMC domain-containing protein [Deltaproteobacteria bacterium]|nr:BMC domain-containing protein [Deltaproteobacteria bacterium]
MGEALGMIETRGMVGAIEAADAALKAAPVRLEQKSHSGGGRVTIIVRGDTAAVQAAVEAGAKAAARVGRLKATHVIPNPDPDVDRMLAGPGQGEYCTIDPAGRRGRGLGLRRRGRGRGK